MVHRRLRRAPHHAPRRDTASLTRLTQIGPSTNVGRVQRNRATCRRRPVRPVFTGSLTPPRKRLRPVAPFACIDTPCLVRVKQARIKLRNNRGLIHLREFAKDKLVAPVTPDYTSPFFDTRNDIRIARPSLFRQSRPPIAARLMTRERRCLAVRQPTLAPAPEGVLRAHLVRPRPPSRGAWRS